MKMRFYLLLFALLPFLLNGCATIESKPTPKPVPTPVTHASFPAEVLTHPGPVLVLFHDNQSWQSLDMQNRFQSFFERYGKAIKFCTFFWDNSEDATVYGLRMIPTVVLYKDGNEADRIRGVPEKDPIRAVWNSDIDLWIQKTALDRQGDQFAGSFKYRFNDSSTLAISNY